MREFARDFSAKRRTQHKMKKKKKKNELKAKVLQYDCIIKIVHLHFSFMWIIFFEEERVILKTQIFEWIFGSKYIVYIISFLSIWGYFYQSIYIDHRFHPFFTPLEILNVYIKSLTVTSWPLCKSPFKLWHICWIKRCSSALKLKKFF